MFFVENRLDSLGRYCVWCPASASYSQRPSKVVQLRILDFWDASETDHGASGGNIELNGRKVVWAAAVHTERIASVPVEV